MRRRELMLLLGAAMTAARALRAQQKAIPVIGSLGIASPVPAAPFVAAFRQGLGETGYVEGQNLAIEYRGAEGRYDRLPALAAELVGRKVDVIVAQADVLALAAKSATSTIPIVFVAGNPVAVGLVASLARPGRNLTGVSILTIELIPKRFELLSELVPQAKSIALLVNPNNAYAEHVIRDVQETARAKGLQLHILKAGPEGELEPAFASLVQAQAGALLVSPDSFFISRREQLVALAARYAVPAIYEWREFTAAGGLISYGTSLIGIYRQVGIYAGKILNGAKPADLPVSAADHLRAGRQSEDRQGTRPHGAANDPRPRRRGHRMRRWRSQGQRPALLTAHRYAVRWANDSILRRQADRGVVPGSVRTRFSGDCPQGEAQAGGNQCGEPIK
jgi:putative ABC transport system substrate-binding protein